MAEQKIEFRKVREFGENLGGTFTFIRENFKPLIAPFFAICGTIMLLQAVLSGMYQSNSLSMIDDLLNRRAVKQQSLSEVFNWMYIVLLLLIVANYTAMQVVVASYIKFYVDNNGAQPTIEEVWQIFKKYFFRVLFYSIPLILLTMVGFVICLAPGVWLSVVFAPFVMVVVMEDEDFGGTFNRCFVLVKENFWISFLVYFVAYLIFAISSGIINGVVGIIAGIFALFTAHSVGTTVGVVTSFFTIFSLTFFIVYAVSIAFHYFNLVELHDGTGILSRIESIGEKDHDLNTDEEY